MATTCMYTGSSLSVECLPHRANIVQLSDFGPGYSGLYALLCIYLFGTVCSATGVYIYEK